MSQQPALSRNEYHVHDEKITNENMLEKYACPCNNFLRGKMRKRQVIFAHMLRFGHNGIIPFPQNSYQNRIPLKVMRDVEAPKTDKDAKNVDEYAMLDEGIEFDRMMSEAFKDDWKKLMEDDSKPVYGPCKFSNLTTILVLLNLKTVCG